MTMIPEALPPLPFQLPEMLDLVEKYERTRQREIDARNAYTAARQAIAPAEQADRRAQAESIRAGGTAADAGWANLEAAQDALADADDEHAAALALCKLQRREWVAEVRVNLGDMLDRADAETEAAANRYSEAIAALLERRAEYLSANGWRIFLRRFEETDDGAWLRWMPGNGDGEVSYQGAGSRPSQFDCRHLESMLRADASRHVPDEPPKRRTADDEILAQSLALAAEGKRPLGRR